ncbi:MAG: GspE/PulE family protein [Candidatus Paceibacterota bacterium]|jgi:type IV pilus assembly protein PilB
MSEEGSHIQDQLMKMRREAEERDAKRRAESHGLPYLPPSKIVVNLEALSVLPEEQIKEGQCAVIAIRDKKIALVTYDPKYSKTVEIIGDLKNKEYKINIFVASLSSLEYIGSFYKFVQKKREVISGKVKVGRENDKKSVGEIKTALDSVDSVKKTLDEHSNAGQISDIVEIILWGAMGNRASDIHLEPSQDFVKLRYRIDGNLNNIFDKFSLGTYKAILSRIKLLSNLKLNVKDEPQDGRFTINLPNKDVEVRVAIAPSEFGEVVVMRLLDPDAINLTLQDLGFRDDDLKIVEEQLNKPYGMALNTGPTGSGKTTTLYAFLRHKISSEIKIITIEDPIEYHLKGIEQTQVNNEAGYSFASGLRSLMRQDPDVILVGEIRDKETAEIAVQAALTGHLVFSTVHANESASAVPRLVDLGVKAASLAPALNLLIAQRLVRRLCKFCKVKEKTINNELWEMIKKYVEAMPARVDKEKYLKNIEIYKPASCDKCNNTGYKGRVGIYELLVINEKIQELIMKEAGQLEIEKEIKSTDFVSMKQDGVLKLISGLTTLEEIEDVAGKVEWI